MSSRKDRASHTRFALVKHMACISTYIMISRFELTILSRASAGSSEIEVEATLDSSDQARADHGSSAMVESRDRGPIYCGFYFGVEWFFNMASERVVGDREEAGKYGRGHEQYGAIASTIPRRHGIFNT